MLEDLLELVPPAADARLAYGPGRCQFGELRFGRREGRNVIVMNVHGGFWRNRYDLAHAGHFCAALSHRGFTTWNIEYRRVGDEGGGWPGSLEDVRLAWNFIPELARKYGLQAAKIIVTGHSAGGQLALCLAAYERSVRNVVSLAGVVDLQRAWELHLSDNAVAEFLGGSPKEVPQTYRAADPMQLSVPDCRQLLIHGAAEDVVPVEFSRSYCERKKSFGEEVRFVKVAGANHLDLIDPRSTAWTRVEAAITELTHSPQRAQRNTEEG